MRAWSGPVVPSLADAGLGRGPALRLHDTASEALVEVDPAERARMYVCGITPYDATHLGHAATFLAFDLAVRVWLDRGLEVAYVQNVTDVDDPLLERAEATGVEWTDLAERETELFRTDMAALAIVPPNQYLGAVETIPLVVDVVERLRERGAVYDVDGDLYFSVHADPTFGRVSGLDAATMRAVFAERGGDPDRPGKRDPLDCLVWRAERPGEPAWDTALGRGRPGWHVECASMALAHLGPGIDVQGGGSDLAFPHHEMSASEAQVACDGQPFARTFVHAGMVAYDGEKMSKSKGNLVLVSALREAGHDPRALRLALLAQHYRSDWEWTDGDLQRGLERLGLWSEAAAVAPAGDDDGTEVGADGGAGVVAEIREALARDLDAPAALSVVDAWAASVLVDGIGSRAVPRAVDALLGVRL